MLFQRIVHTKDYLPSRAYQDESYLMHMVYSFAQSKIGTSLFMEGKSDWDVLDEDPEKEDQQFCSAFIPLTNIYIEFEGAKDLPKYKGRDYYTVGRGDVMVFTGMHPSKIHIIDENKEPYNNEFLSYPYDIKTFKMAPKKPKGVGKNKYKVSITFSDTYEIEVMANNEEDAKLYAMEAGFSAWDHIYEIDENNWQEYKSQRVRYSMWRPQDIQINQMLTNPDN